MPYGQNMEVLLALSHRGSSPRRLNAWAGMLAALIMLSPAARAITPAKQLEILAERFVDESLTYDPTLAYEAGLSTTIHDRFADRTPSALAAFDAEEREDLAALRRLNAKALPADSMATYARLHEKLESDLQLRVCQKELWNVNHMEGWQSAFADVADAQPVATPDERAQALMHWSSLPASHTRPCPATTCRSRWRMS